MYTRIVYTARRRRFPNSMGSAARNFQITIVCYLGLHADDEGILLSS